MFSSNRCCFAPLNNPASAALEEYGEDRREEEGKEGVFEEVDGIEVPAAAAAATQLSCRRERAVVNRAKSILGGRGRDEGGERCKAVESPPLAEETSRLHRSSSALRFCCLSWVLVLAELTS